VKVKRLTVNLISRYKTLLFYLKAVRKVCTRSGGTVSGLKMNPMVKRMAPADASSRNRRSGSGRAAGAALICRPPILIKVGGSGRG